MGLVNDWIAANYDIRPEVLDHIVNEYPDICPQIYSDALPTTTGIGVIYTFILQTVAVIVFGAILSTVCLLTSKATTKADFHLIRLKKLSWLAMGTSAFVTFVVGAMLHVRKWNGPRDIELVFLRRMRNFLNSTNNFGIYTFMTFQASNVPSSAWDHLILLANVIDQLLVHSIGTIDSVPRTSSAMIVLLNACDKKVGVPPMTALSASDPERLPWMLIMLILVPVAIGVGIVIGAYGHAFKNLMKRLGINCYVAIWTACCVIFVVVAHSFNITFIRWCVSLMWCQRDHILVATQTTDVGNQWTLLQRTVSYQSSLSVTS